VRSARIIGPGRAGRSVAAALEQMGWRICGLWGREHDPAPAAAGVDALVVATPDDAVAAVARAVRPDPHAVVMHLSGSLGLDVLAPHRHTAALHPLVAMPNPAVGSDRLLRGATFAVTGHPMAAEMAQALGGTVVMVDDSQRAAYHAAASIAANHVVALLGQVERVAASAGLEVDAFLGLTRDAVEDVARLGPGAALTGPAARGDWATLARHRDALAPEERPAYNAGVALAVRLAGDKVARDRHAGDAGVPEPPQTQPVAAVQG
jgi:predicted short-subunit dehydrogenase-like oxidoreductase (DUF2520 family)